MRCNHFYKSCTQNLLRSIETRLNLSNSMYLSTDHGTGLDCTPTILVNGYMSNILLQVVFCCGDFSSRYSMFYHTPSGRESDPVEPVEFLFRRKYEPRLEHELVCTGTKVPHRARSKGVSTLRFYFRVWIDKRDEPGIAFTKQSRTKSPQQKTFSYLLLPLETKDLSKKPLPSR